MTGRTGQPVAPLSPPAARPGSRSAPAQEPQPVQESTVPAAADDDDLWPEAAGGDWPEPAAGSPRPPAEVLSDRPPDPEPETGGSASGGSSTVQLVQELFPGRIVSREPLNTTEEIGRAHV